MGTAKNEFFRLPRKPANAHFIRAFGDAEKFFCTYLTQSDDLGRVVVPKEIRRTLRIREGDPLEIFTDKEGEIILKKYSPMGDLLNIVKELCQAAAKTSKRTVAICDRDSIITAYGSLAKQINELTIRNELKQLMEERIRYDMRNNKRRYFIGENQIGEVAIAYPIISAGDVTGCVLFLVEEGKRGITDQEVVLAEMMVYFLSGQLDN